MGVLYLASNGCLDDLHSPTLAINLLTNPNPLTPPLPVMHSKQSQIVRLTGTVGITPSKIRYMRQPLIRVNAQPLNQRRNCVVNRAPFIRPQQPTGGIQQFEVIGQSQIYGCPKSNTIYFPWEVVSNIWVSYIYVLTPLILLYFCRSRK